MAITMSLFDSDYCGEQITKSNLVMVIKNLEHGKWFSENSICVYMRYAYNVFFLVENKDEVD